MNYGYAGGDRERRHRRRGEIVDRVSAATPCDNFVTSDDFVRDSTQRRRQGEVVLLLKPSYGASVHVYSELGLLGASSGGWAAHWGEGFGGPQLAQVVVCSMPDHAKVYLLGLDEQGHVVHDSEHDSVEDAKSYAESEFPMLVDAWRQ